MKHTIFYFSGTGNTWLMADRINNRLKEEGIDSSCYSIETLDKEAIQDIVKETDHLIIGYPIYGSEAPRPMQEFIDELSRSKDKKPVSVFCTQAFASGDGANYLEKKLLSKNYTLTQTKEFKLSNNFYIPVFVRAFKVGDQEKINKRKENAFSKAERFIIAIVKQEIYVKKVSLIGKFLGDFQRKEVDDLIKKVNNAFLIDDTCIHCNLCVSLCPVNNIKEVENQIVIGEKCVACMRCYQACPKSSILLKKASKDLKKYPRFKGPIENFDFRTMKNSNNV